MCDGLQYKFWVYILSSRTGTLYTGITGFFTRRIHQHKYDSIEGFTKKYQCHRLVYESHQDVEVAIGREKQIKRWRAGEEDRFDRENEFSLAGPRRELGPGNALSGTVSRSNSLNRHRCAVILGISPLALSLPLCGIHRGRSR